MKKFAILFIAAPALLLAAGNARAGEWRADQAAASDGLATAAAEFSAQSRRTRSAPRRAGAAQTPAREQAPVGPRIGVDPDANVRFEIVRSRGHAG